MSKMISIKRKDVEDLLINKQHRINYKISMLIYQEKTINDILKVSNKLTDLENEIDKVI